MNTEIQHHVLQQKINDILYKIKHEYPELYRNLDEATVWNTSPGSTEITTAQFCEYLDLLQEKLNHYMASHPH